MTNVSLRQLVPLFKDASTLSLVYDSSAHSFDAQDDMFLFAWGDYAVKSICASRDIRYTDKEAMAYEIVLCTASVKVVRG